MKENAMPRRTDRRQFLTHTAATGAALAAAPFAFPTSARAAEPDITIGLSQYSLRQLFGKTLDVMDYPRFARETFGITEIDVWEGGLPGDRRDDPKFLRELKRRAEDEGSNIFLWMTSPVDARTDAQDQFSRFRQPIENASVLGCRYVRIFLRAPNDPQKASAERCAEVLAPIADYARDRQIILAIEPGASKLSANGEFLAQLMEVLDHDHCRLMPDFGKFRGDVYAGTEAMMPHSVVVSAKSHDFDKQGDEKRFDYDRLMKIVVESGFEGIVAIEYEGSRLSPVEGVTATQKLLQRALAEEADDS